MTIKEFIEIRNNEILRDNFIVTTTQKNKYNIYSLSKKIAGKLSTPDIIKNECTQYFMLGLNRGIDQAKITDDGRGKNEPDLYCIRLGFYNIRDFLIREFRLNRKFHPEFTSITEKENLLPNIIQESNEIIGSIYVKEIIEKLKPIDREILQLILYGESNGKIIYPYINNKNVIDNNIIKTVANTLGYSTNYIYSRIYVLRSVFSTMEIF